MPSPSPDDYTRIVTHLLEAQHVVVTDVFAPQVVASMRFSQDMDHHLDRMISKLETLVYAEKTTEDKDVGFTHYFEFPANPWQYLKERFAPDWYVRLRPVKYEYEKSYGRVTITRTSWAKWPDMSYVPREMGRPFVVNECESGSWFAQ